MADVFEMQKQAETYWCWAAVGASINNYFLPDTALQQCKLVNEVLGLESDACASPFPQETNKDSDLQDVLGAINTLRKLETAALPFSKIQTEINNSLPVCVRIGWHGSETDGHFVVVSGFAITSTGEQWVEIADPLYGYWTLPYSQFVHAYQQAGEWTDTFLVQKPAAKEPRQTGTV